MKNVYTRENYLGPLFRPFCLFASLSKTYWLKENDWGRKKKYEGKANK